MRMYTRWAKKAGPQTHDHNSVKSYPKRFIKKSFTGRFLGKFAVKWIWVCDWKKLKSVNIWQSYEQERGCLVHFFGLVAVCWPGAQSAWDNTMLLLVTLPNIHQLKNYTHTLSNKPFLIWLLTTPTHLKYVATLPCNFLWIAFFLTLMFHKVL